MAYPDLGRACLLEYNDAIALRNTQRHGEFILRLEVMLLEPYLPIWIKFNVHKTLASVVHETFITREHLEAAETAYAELMRRWPPGNPGPNDLAERVRLMRADMDQTWEHILEEEQEERAEADQQQEASESVAEDEQRNAQEDPTVAFDLPVRTLNNSEVPVPTTEPTSSSEGQGLRPSPSMRQTRLDEYFHPRD